MLWTGTQQSPIRLTAPNMFADTVATHQFQYGQGHRERYVCSGRDRETVPSISSRLDGQAGEEDGRLLS